MEYSCRPDGQRRRRVNWKTLVLGSGMAALLVCASDARGETALAVKNLRCEYKVDPMGIDVRKPVAQPDVAPALGLGELDKVLGERVRLLLAGVDIGGAEHVAPDLGALPCPFGD